MIAEAFAPMPDPKSPFSPDVLLEHHDFLRVLARSLLADEHAADDVLQETYVAALTRPPAVVDSARAWLARVAHNLALNRLRGEHRRSRRESAASRAESAPHDFEVGERLEEQRRVVEAVLALRDPYRTVVYLRFNEGLPPREIAARLDVPIETVRSRLKRALAMLRADLERELGDRRTSRLLLARLASSGGGALAVKGAIAIAAALVLCLAAGFVASEGTSEADGPARRTSVLSFAGSRPAAAPASRTRSGESTTAGPIARSQAAHERTPALQAIPAAPARRAGLVYRLDLASPAGLAPDDLVARLAFDDVTPIDETAPTAPVRAGDPPEAAFDVPPPISLVDRTGRSSYVLHVESRDGFSGDRARVHAIDPGEGLVGIALEPRGVVAGRILDEDGAPVAGARVRVEHDASTDAAPSRTTSTDASGAYRIGGIEPDACRIVVRSARHAALARPVDVVAGEALELDLRLERLATASFAGSLASRAGRAHALREVRLRSGTLEVVTAPIASPDGRTASFRFDDVPVGEYELVPPLDEGFAWDPAIVRVSVPGPEVRMTRLDGVATRTLSFEAIDDETGVVIDTFRAVLLVDRYALGKRHALAAGPGPAARETRSGATFTETLPRGVPAYWAVECEGYRSAYGDLGDARRTAEGFVVEARLARSWRLELAIEALGPDGRVIDLAGVEARTSGGKLLAQSLADGRVQLELTYDPGRLELALAGWKVERWEGFRGGRRRSLLDVHRVWMERD